MAPLLRYFADARSPHDIVAATSRFLEEDLRASPVPLKELGLIRVETLEDIEIWIQRIQDAIRDTALIGHDEDRVDRLLGYLLVASIRAKQLQV